MQLHPSTWHFLPWLKKLILLWRKNSCCEEKFFLWRKTACFEENLATLFLSPLLLVSRPPPAHICARFYPFHLFLTIMPPPTPSLVTAPLIHLSSHLNHILCDTFYTPPHPPRKNMKTSLWWPRWQISQIDVVPESLQNGFIPNGLVFIFKDWANKGWFFCSGKVLLSLGAFSQIPLSHFYLKCCLHLQKRRKIPNCIWAGGFVSAVLQCLHIPTILLKGLSFFSVKFFWFKMALGEFSHFFLGQIKPKYWYLG